MKTQLTKNVFRCQYFPPKFFLHFFLRSNGLCEPLPAPQRPLRRRVRPLRVSARCGDDRGQVVGPCGFFEIPPGLAVVGGGLEVAMAGSMIFASPDAQLGQPEMKLGVFAPAASVLLPYRVNAAVAEDLLLSGRSVGASLFE